MRPKAARLARDWHKLGALDPFERLMNAAA